MKANLIRQIPLFASLPEDEADRLASTLEECAFRPGEIVMTEGSRSTFFYLMIEGEVEIVKALGTPDERIVALVQPGSVLGEMSMFSRDGSHTASVRAHTQLNLLRMSFEQFDSLLNRSPAMVHDLLRMYSRRLEESESLTIQDLREKNRQLTIAYEELQAAQAAMIEKEKLEHELQIAAGIQRSILPERIPEYTGLDFGALMVPARRVGGDFYDFIPLDEHRVGIVVGDVCDKGVPAALFMALAYSIIRIEAFHQDSPGDTLRAVNIHLTQVNRMNMYVTLLYGILDCRTAQFSYARAGHPEPLVLDGSLALVPVHLGLGQPIGLFDEPALDEQTIQVPPGGLMLIYSDGLSETIDIRQDTPELPEMCSAMLAGGGCAAQALCDRLWQAVGLPAVDAPILDDFTVVAVKRTAA